MVIKAGTQPKNVWVIKNFFGVKSILLHCSLYWRTNVKGLMYGATGREKTGIVHLFIYFTIHSLICSYNDYIKPLCRGKMHLNRIGPAKRRLVMKWPQERSCNGINFSYTAFNNSIPQCGECISKGHWRSILLLRMIQLSKRITNVLNPDFTVGLILDNPLIGAARLPEVLRSWVKLKVNRTGVPCKNLLVDKLFCLLLNLKIMIVSSSAKVFEVWMRHISSSEDCFIAVKLTQFWD